MNKWTRRGFIGSGIIGSGALVIGVALRPGNQVGEVRNLIESGDEKALNLWVKLDPDNHITVIVPHVEMGQGAQTGLAMMLAEEMEADWEMLSVEEAPAHQEYATYHLARGFITNRYDFPLLFLPSVDGLFRKVSQAIGLQITGGSASIAMTGEYAMRVAGAAAKEMLLSAAASAWDLPVGTLQASAGFISSENGRREPFAAFIEAAAGRKLNSSPVLKKRSEFKIIGNTHERFDLPPKVDGSAIFGIDVDIPGLKYAAIHASPIFGGRLVSFDRIPVEQSEGVISAVQLEDAIAVVAESYWDAEQALLKANVEFDGGEQQLVSSESLQWQFARSLDEDRKHSIFERGNTTQALKKSVDTLETEYSVPFLAHATMEPMNCTARMNADGTCEIWTGTQNPLGFRYEVATALGLDKDKVILRNQLLGGGFGRRSISDYAVQAARIAKKSGYPVKLIWSRSQDIKQDHYRPAVLSRFKAGLDQEGRPIAWRNSFVFKHDPAGASQIPYFVPHQQIEYTQPDMHIRFGPWRSVDHSQHGFFIESFVDELAHAAGQDPYQYRRMLLSHRPDYLRVLDEVAEFSNWPNEQRSAAGNNDTAKTGMGIAIRESFGTIVAQVAKVRVQKNRIRITDVFCVADAGIAVNPDSFVAQMESGIVFGATAALFGNIEIVAGGIKQSNFHDYKMLRMSDAPRIHTRIINSDRKTGGAGEPGTPPIAPAVANAVFAATGERIRHLPLEKHKFDLG